MAKQEVNSCGGWEKRAGRWASLGLGLAAAVLFGACSNPTIQPEPLDRYGAGARPPYPSGGSGTVDPLVPSGGGAAGWEGRRSNYGGGVAGGAPGYGGGYGQQGGGSGYGGGYGQPGGGMVPGGGDEVDRLFNQAGVGEVGMPGGGGGATGSVTGGGGAGVGSVTGGAGGVPQTGQVVDEIPVARAVPGEPGRVFSPFGDGVRQKVDVSGFERGRVVFDPHSGKKFRVP